jgi:hypothetical protein
MKSLQFIREEIRSRIKITIRSGYPKEKRNAPNERDSMHFSFL